MLVLFRIAVRNLRQHRTKTTIIGIIMAVGVMILVIGNTLINTIDTGIERSFINNYTGNVMITGVSDNSISLFGVQSPGGVEEAPTIADYDRVLEHLKSLDGIDDIVSQVTGFGIINIEEADEDKGPYFALLFGIDPGTYRKAFGNVEIVDGRYLAPGEEGILISEMNLESMNEIFETSAGAGDKILITAPGSAGFKIREVPIRGVYRLKFDSEAMSYISYIDAQTLRILKGLNLGTQADIVLSDDEIGLLGEESLDSLFEADSFAGEAELDFEITEDNLQSILDLDSGISASIPDAAEPAVQSASSGSSTWEYILLKTGSQRSAARIIPRLNSWFEQQGIAAKAWDWKAAAGPFSTTADVIRLIFNVAIVLVAVVAVIIMTNTLVINVVERTSEIGTMRALGAQKGVIRRMFTAEVFVISVIFGFLGTAAGVAVLLIVRLIGFEATNAFLEILFAGAVLKPVFSVFSILGSWLIVILIGAAANIYPLKLALAVQPIRAMSAE